MTINLDAEITNLGAPMVANTAFGALAEQAGLVATIKSLVGLATDIYSLTILLKQTLWDDNQPLSLAINVDTLKYFLKYMVTIGESVVMSDDLPEMLNMNGPASVSAYRAPEELTQVNVGFTAPPNGFECQIFLDGVYVKTSTEAPSGENVFDSIQGVVAGNHNVRFIYRRVADGAMSRFSAVINIS